MRLNQLRAAVVTIGVSVSSPGCDNSAGPNPVERWSADIPSRQQVLSMTLTRDGNTVRGSGTLANLTNPGGETLTLTGMRNADSLRVFYSRQNADPFRFVGRYVGPGLVGILDGAEFSEVGVGFRSR